VFGVSGWQRNYFTPAWNFMATNSPGWERTQSSTVSVRRDLAAAKRGQNASGKAQYFYRETFISTVHSVPSTNLVLPAYQGRIGYGTDTFKAVNMIKTCTFVRNCAPRTVHIHQITLARVDRPYQRQNRLDAIAPVGWAALAWWCGSARACARETVIAQSTIPDLTARRKRPVAGGQFQASASSAVADGCIR
jgi:hypothetical protein